MPAKPELVIPLRMDLATALKDVSTVDERLSRLTKETKEGMEGAGSAARGLGAALSAIALDSGVQLARDAAAAIMQSMKDSYEYTKRLGEQFIQTQQSMQQVAALMGKANTDQFTEDQARAAGQARLSVPEWVRFQEQFQSFGGASLDKLRGGDAAATSYQQRVAEFAKARGIPASEAARLAGNILQFAPGEITEGEALSQFGKIFTALERSPTPVPELLPQMARLMGQGATGTEASELLNIASRFRPGEEGTYVQASIRGLRQAMQEGRGDELGIKSGMSPVDMLRNATRAIESRVQGGENLDDVLTDLFHRRDEVKQGITGFLNEGLRGGGFEQARGFTSGTGRDAVVRGIADWEQSAAGRRAGVLAQRSVSEAVAGARDAQQAEERMRAENQLTEEGRFRWSLANMPADVLMTLTGGDNRNRLIEQRVFRNQAQAIGAEGYGAETAAGLMPAAITSSMNSAVEALNPANLASAAIGKLLSRIADATEQTAGQNPGPRPLANPAPRVHRAPGG